MHDLYLFRTFYGAYQTFVNGYYVSATAYDQYATTRSRLSRISIRLTIRSFIGPNRHPAGGPMLIISKEILTKDWHTVLCRYLLTVLHTIVISWPFITNVATVYTVSWSPGVNLSYPPIRSWESIYSWWLHAKRYEKVNDTGYNNKNIYKNPYALELGYKTSDDISSEIHADNILEYQNALLSRIVGHLVQCYKTCTAEKRK